MKQKLGVELLAYLGGGTNDNANDAQKEIKLAIELAQKEVESSDDPEIRKLVFLNCVKTLPIILGDGYHIGNLITTGMSIRGFGDDTVKGDFRQVHHRQLLQTFHDLRSANKQLAQETMDEIILAAKESSVG